MLKEAADRMAHAIRGSDVAARLGGDEFAVLLLGANQENAQAVAESLVESLSLPYPKIRVGVSASVGIAVYPQSGVTLSLIHIYGGVRAIPTWRWKSPRPTATRPTTSR